MTIRHGWFSYEFDVRLRMIRQIFMVRKGSKLILIQQEATDSKSKFSFFPRENFSECFLSAIKYTQIITTILNISYSKLFLQQQINFKYRIMVSPRFLKSYGWPMLGILFLTGKVLLVFCSSYFSCLHPQFFAFCSYSFESYHKDKHTSHITFLMFCVCLYKWQLYQQLFQNFPINPFQPNIAFNIKNSNIFALQIKWLISTCIATMW